MLLWLLQDYTSFKKLIKAPAKFFWGYTLCTFDLSFLMLSSAKWNSCYCCAMFVKSIGVLSSHYDICENCFPETVTFPSRVSYLINIPLSQRGSFTGNVYLLQVYNLIGSINEFLNLEIIIIFSVSLFNTVQF